MSSQLKARYPELFRNLETFRSAPAALESRMYEGEKYRVLHAVKSDEATHMQMYSLLRALNERYDDMRFVCISEDGTNVPALFEICVRPTRIRAEFDALHARCVKIEAMLERMIDAVTKP